MLKPDFYYHRVQDIDLDLLRARGIGTLLVDLDNTLLPRDASEITSELRAWASGLAEAGFKVCLVSNNWHSHVFGVADELGFEIAPKALKPLPFGFLKGLRKTGSSRSAAAVVGDQMFTDVLGGKWLGIATILVVPLSKTDLPHTLLLRKIERYLLADRRPLP